MDSRIIEAFADYSGWHLEQVKAALPAGKTLLGYTDFAAGYRAGLLAASELVKTPPMLAYAGIGSRQTPDGLMGVMRLIARTQARRGRTLRSGAAEGADSAFEAGCDAAHGKKEIYLPWDGFNARSAQEPGVFVLIDSPEATAIASKAHPAWERLSQGARRLHVRNTYQVLGRQLNDPVAFVVCWTPDGKGGGGTGQAIRLAESHGIPVFDLGIGVAEVERKFRSMFGESLCE